MEPGLATVRTQVRKEWLQLPPEREKSAADDPHLPTLHSPLNPLAPGLLADRCTRRHSAFVSIMP
jgi:hypothetical protein